MKNRPNWVAVRTRYREETGRYEKYLINPKTGKFAESDNPETWTNFEEACKYARENGGDTLAYALDGKDNIFCIDVDHCYENGAVVSDLVSDIEESGVHIPIANVPSAATACITSERQRGSTSVRSVRTVKWSFIRSRISLR